MRCWIRAWRHSQYTRIKYLLWNNADLYNSRHVFFIFLWVDYMTLFFFTPPPPHPAPLTSNHRSGGQRNRGSERCQRDPGSGQICWHMHGLFGKGRTLNQHGQTVVNSVGPISKMTLEQLTPFVNVGQTILPTKCQLWTNKWLLQ